MERCSQLVGALTLSLAETELLPYNMADLGHALLEGFGDLQTHMEDFQMHNVSAENSYRTVAFPVLRLQLYQVSRMKPGSGEAAQAWLDIRRSVNDIALAIRTARMMLDPDRIV
ncbi:unnamed protein product [Ixodes persulcatus]